MHSLLRKKTAAILRAQTEIQPVSLHIYKNNTLVRTNYKSTIKLMLMEIERHLSCTCLREHPSDLLGLSVPINGIHKPGLGAQVAQP